MCASEPDRRVAGLGANERYLAIDYMRGAIVETKVIKLVSDSAIRVFARELQEQVATIDEALEEAEAAAAELTAKPPASSSAPIPLGVADELGKLAELRNKGVLTEDEFLRQKAKLLGQEP